MKMQTTRCLYIAFLWFTGCTMDGVITYRACVRTKTVGSDHNQRTRVGK